MSAAGFYFELAQLAEAGLLLAEEGRFDELEALHSREAEIVAALPDRAPASAQAPLARAADAQARTTALLAAALSEVGAELERVGRGRHAARSYGGRAGA